MDLRSSVYRWETTNREFGILRYTAGEVRVGNRIIHIMSFQYLPIQFVMEKPLSFFVVPHVARR